MEISDLPSVALVGEIAKFCGSLTVVGITLWFILRAKISQEFTNNAEFKELKTTVSTLANNITDSFITKSEFKILFEEYRSTDGQWANKTDEQIKRLIAVTDQQQEKISGMAATLKVIDERVRNMPDTAQVGHITADLAELKGMFTILQSKLDRVL